MGIMLGKGKGLKVLTDTARGEPVADMPEGRGAEMPALQGS
jgi:hypothetical protein